MSNLSEQALNLGEVYLGFKFRASLSNVNNTFTYPLKPRNMPASKSEKTKEQSLVEGDFDTYFNYNRRLKKRPYDEFESSEDEESPRKKKIVEMDPAEIKIKDLEGTVAELWNFIVKQGMIKSEPRSFMFTLQRES